MKVIAGIFLLSPLAMQAQKGFEMKGNIAGLEDKSVVFLIDANNPTDTISKTIANKTTFTLKGNIESPQLYYLGFAGQQKKTAMFLDNSKMTVTGSINDIKTLKVTGSRSQKDFEEFQSTFNPYFDKLNQSNQASQAGMNDSLQSEIQKNIAVIMQKTDDFIAQKPSSPVSPFLILVTAQFSQDLSVLENRYNKLGDEAKGSFFGKYLNQQITIAKAGAIGSKAPEFTQNDVEGRPVSLSSFKGKYVLIDFWASWCGPCRMENPNVLAAFNRFKSKNFTVLGISLDKDKDAWVKAINADGLTWTQLSDLKAWQNEVAAMYKVQTIPQNFLVDPSGNIVAKNLRGSDLESKLCELLGCN